MSSTEKKVKKVFLYLDESLYQDRLAKHEKYHKHLDAIIDELKRLGEVLEEDREEIEVDPLEFVKSFVMALYEDRNTLGLSYEKLKDVLELNLSRVENEARELAKLPEWYGDPVDEEDYKVYAETEYELKLLKTMENTAKSINTLESLGERNMPTFFMQFMRRFNQHMFSMTEGDICLNKSYVKRAAQIKKSNTLH